jgi:hypothetical protein
MSNEHDNETWGFIKGGEFLDQLNDCKFVKKYRALWRYYKQSSVWSNSFLCEHGSLIESGPEG